LLQEAGSLWGLMLSGLVACSRGFAELLHGYGRKKARPVEKNLGFWVLKRGKK
jgi:hypothetical protein